MLFALCLTLLPSIQEKAPPTPRSDPAQAKPGQVLAWTARNGLPFEFRVPANYDPERRAATGIVQASGGRGAHGVGAWGEEVEPDQAQPTLLGTQLTQACSVPFGVLALVDRGWCAGAGKEGEEQKVWQPSHVGSTPGESGGQDGFKSGQFPWYTSPPIQGSALAVTISLG